MANQQHINPGDVAKAAKDLQLFANQLTARLNKIKGEVDTASKVYTGLGSNAFQQSMTRWDGAAIDIRRAVFELAALVRRAGTEHVGGDQAGADGFNRGGIDGFNQAVYRGRM